MNLPKLGVLVLLLVAGLVVAVAAAPQESRQDPQAGYEPRSAPGAGQKFLEKMVGDWEVTKTFHPRTGAPAVSKGTCRQSMMHAGRFLRSDFVFGEGEAATTGMGMVGFDAQAGTFTSVWTDSRSTRMSFRQSEGKFSGDEIVLFSRALGEATKEGARRSKTVTRLEDEDKKLLHRQYSIDAEGKERLMMELAMTRKPAAPPGK